MSRKMLLDCDTGVDDAIAILYAALAPGIDLVGVGAVWGNVDVGIATTNTLSVLELAGRSDVPVARGAAGPIDGSPAVFAYHVHGPDGQGGVGRAVSGNRPEQETAAEQIVRIVKADPGAVEIVAVGPLTNLAAALVLCPELPTLVTGVTVMGGAALAPGNVTPMAEANIWCDPVAAHAVFAAGWPITLVPLDVTMKVLLTEAHRARLAAGRSEVGRYVAAITDFYFDFFAVNAFGSRCSAMHDVLAVAIAAEHLVPSLAPIVRASVDISDGPSRGATICDLRGKYMAYPPQDDARCRVVLEVPRGFQDEVVAFLETADTAVERTG